MKSTIESHLTRLPTKLAKFDHSITGAISEDNQYNFKKFFLKTIRNRGDSMLIEIICSFAWNQRCNHSCKEKAFKGLKSMRVLGIRDSNQLKSESLIVRTQVQGWSDYMTNVIDYNYDYLPILQLRLRLLKMIMCFSKYTTEILKCIGRIIFFSISIPISI